ncbi:MAG TPA: hypothetical protein PLJ34_01680, partial [Hyphomicrobiales bacterium]|nr:hypothetical protein [Hyphomicrobiales bacterium]
MSSGPQFSRRAVIAAAAALPVAARTSAMPRDDEAFWRTIAAEYDVTDEVIQLENGNWGMMARPVQAAYAEWLERV